MDAATILDSLDTLTVAELRRVAARAIELLRFYDEMAQPAPNVVETIVSPGGHYRAEMVRCGQERCKKCAEGAYGHGPYWYLYQYSGGKVRKSYIGKKRPE
jgi:hypothetical protein